MKARILAHSTIFILCTSLLSAADWNNWRGPEMNGSSSASNTPQSFSTDNGVRWSVDMPGAAASTPIISGNHVFVSSTDRAKENLIALAYDLKTGKELWRHVVAQGLKQDDRSNYAGASPASDGKHVVFFYGTGDIAVFTMEGKPVWKKNIQEEYGKFYFLWTFSTSPLLHGENIIMQVLQRDTPVHNFQRGGGKHSSYLLALSMKDGSKVYQVERPDEARAEAKEAFSTPVLYDHKGKTQLLVTGGDCITGHDPATGKEIWRWGTWNPDKIGHWRLVPSPIAGNGIALACAPKGAPVYAVKLGGNGKLDDSHIAWKSTNPNVSSDVPTPLFYRGHFYVANNGRKRTHALSCIEPETGKVIWSEDLGVNGKIEASPTAADGKIYIITHYGEVVVVEAGDKFKALHKVEMGPGRNGRVRSSIALADGLALIRTDKKLFCIGK
jgi:outer membrane protein assembly factor BamB